jgi:D-sedoheptulose 7-phosphate isomerase
MNLSPLSSAFADSVRQALTDTEADAHWEVPTGRIFLVGNGGSAAIASHIATDLMKSGRSAYVLTDPATFSAYANDSGYAHVYQDQLLQHAGRVSTLVAISSSGQSPNILNAAHAALDQGWSVVTLSGFKSTNPLRSIGHYNYWVPSKNYGVVEIAHLTILHALVNPG